MQQMMQMMHQMQFQAPAQAPAPAQAQARWHARAASPAPSESQNSFRSASPAATVVETPAPVQPVARVAFRFQPVVPAAAAAQQDVFRGYVPRDINPAGERRPGSH
jgi:hypothetical protein